MRILVVTQYFWPESFRVNDVCLSLKEKGHNVTVLTGIPNYPEGKFFSGYGVFRPLRQNYNGINIIRIPLIPRKNGRGWQLALNYSSFAFLASIFAPFFCHENYDIIIVYQLSPVTMALPAIILKKIHKIPLLLYVLDLWPDSLSAAGTVKSKHVINLVGKLVKYIYANSNQILVSSRGFIPKIKEMGFRESLISYWPQWAEEFYQIVSVESDSPEIKEMPDGFRVIFAGNIGVAQSFETILGAAEILRDHSNIHFVIIGDGRMKSWVEKQVIERDLKSNFHLLGRRLVELMPRYFSLADALLVTLKKDPIFALTLPAKIQSYLACGKPILAAIEGEGASVVEEAKAGFTCEVEDCKALANIILKMYMMTEKERKAMGMRGRVYFEQYFKRDFLLKQLEYWMQNILL